MPDQFATRTRRPSDPASTLFDITPDDAEDLAQATLAVNVKTPGTLRVTMIDGTTGDISVTPGHAFPIRARRVWLTGTTATGITGLA